MRFISHKKQEPTQVHWRPESLGNVRPEQVKRIARELLQLYADKFTTNFNNNKKAIRSLTNISSPKLRNRVAGYVTRLLATQAAQTPQSTTTATAEEKTE